MLKIDYDKKNLLKVLNQVTMKTLDMDLIWDWPCGVAYYGVACAYELTKEQKYLDRLVQWIDEYIEMGLPSWNVNACAMGHVLMTVHEATADERYWEIIQSKIAYLRKDALRFGDSVLQHTVSSSNDFPEQAWADTLFMAAFFMLRYAVKTKDEALLEDSLNQYFWHINYLQDETSSLWYHGYNNINKDHMSGFYWGRANAWAAYTMSQVLKSIPEWYLYPKCMDVDCALRDQLSALKLLQTDDGLWHTLLDDEESYEEVSASCGIAAAMIANKNPLHSKYVQKALTGILANITEDGRVMNVSGGTAVMKDRDGYRKVPRKWAQGWGQGLALAFLSGVISLENDNKTKTGNEVKTNKTRQDISINKSGEEK